MLHNDDFTTREFVIELLTTVFARSREDAEALVQDVHAHGAGIVGLYPLREANRLVERATESARGAEFPLRCRSFQRPDDRDIPTGCFHGVSVVSLIAKGLAQQQGDCRGLDDSQRSSMPAAGHQ